MALGMYLMAIIAGLIVGTYFDPKGKKYENEDLHNWKWIVHAGPFAISLIWMGIFLLVTFIMDITYAFYIGSIRDFIAILILALFINIAANVFHIKSIPWKVISVIIVVAFFLISGTSKYITPSHIDNDLFKSFDNQVSGENPNPINDTQEIRVITWNFATSYLQRSYGNSASYLSTNYNALTDLTDPSYVNGQFVWTNAPMFEFAKWFGEKDVPFFVYIVNDPINMSKGDTNALIHKVNTPLEDHKTRITWQHRIEQLCFDRFAGKYVISQIRIDMDDSYHPYWIIYLSNVDTWYGIKTLKEIMIVDATNIDSHTEYSITDPNIPKWLEVVYPDQYVYDWTAFWGAHRLGLGYSWFNKGHLYDPDDSSARFIVNNGITYWQVPMVQKSSHVLGGYIWVNTRTGEATFYNRESKSMVDYDTVSKQVSRYLSSGALGYQQLSLTEGYLYPIRMNDNSVREAYIFPLYAGLTISKYAIVDAIDYASTPSIDIDLEIAINHYRSYIQPSENITQLSWGNYTILGHYTDKDSNEHLLISPNGTDLDIQVSQGFLSLGLIDNSTGEWNELQYAISRWNRGENITIGLTMNFHNDIKANIVMMIYDVDWEGSDLVTR